VTPAKKAVKRRGERLCGFRLILLLCRYVVTEYAARALTRTLTMSFAVGDHVRYNPQLLASAQPQWRGTTWRIAALTGDLPGQGDRVFARLENDSGDIEDGVSTAMLVPDRNYPVRIDCPHCGDAGATWLPPLGDRSDYRCPHCGDFSVDNSTAWLFESNTRDIKLARIVTDGAGRRWLRPSAGTIIPIGFRTEPDGSIFCPLCCGVAAPQFDLLPRCAQCGGSYCGACHANGDSRLQCSSHRDHPVLRRSRSSGQVPGRIS
jgi:hypothetical protein